MFIDAHCHLERDTYGDELDAVIARAFDAGLTHLVAVGASGVTAGAREAITLAERLDRIYATAGIHPHEAARAGEADLEELARLLAHPKVVALGEIGLDYHYDFSPPDVQRRLFRRQLELGRKLDVPIMLHVREAHADTVALLDEVGLPQRGGIVHCFTAGPAEADAYLSRGLYLSVPGVVTFKNAEELREAVRRMPLDRLLIETDSPYLAPVPYRGQRNEPAYVVKTAETIGALRGLTAEDIGRIAGRNTLDVLGLASEPAAILAYAIRRSLYVNLTSRCTLACSFCPKVERRDYWVKGHWLKLRREPDVEEILAAVGAELARRSDVEEVVFVGLGEPTLRLDALLAVARELRQRHGRRLRLRVDTDGLGSLVHGREIAAELAATVDAVSVSLNAADAETYARLCPSRFGAGAYEAVKQFVRSARDAGLAVTATAVGVPGLDLEACRRVAEDELEVAFRHRVYQQVG